MNVWEDCPQMNNNIAIGMGAHVVGAGAIAIGAGVGVGMVQQSKAIQIALMCIT